MLLVKDPNKKDYLKYNGTTLRKRDGNVVLVNLRYFCNQVHSDYYDHSFNRRVYNWGSYELDSAFWRHCIGEIYCGGIGTYSYGQVEITSFKQGQRVLNIFKNPNEPVRKSFKRKIDKLFNEDLAYEESMEV